MRLYIAQWLTSITDCAQDDIILLNDGRETTIKDYIKDAFDYDYDFRWAAIGICILHIVVLRLIVALATKYLQFQKR
jgi:CDR ABC transporter